MVKKAASVKDIANELHISLSTVHKALTGKPGVSAARRNEVLACAERLGYVVNTNAQTLSRKEFRIGVITPARWSEYFDVLRNGIYNQINKLRDSRVIGEFYVIPAQHDDNEKDRILEWEKKCKPDAVLYCPSHFAINEIAESALSRFNCPVFFVGGGITNTLDAPSITVDASLAGKLAADFLSASLSKPQAAIFTGSLKSAVHKTKCDAFIERVKQNGGTVIRICETEDDPQKAEKAVLDLFQDHPSVNAIYVSTLTSEPVCRYIEKNSLTDHIRVVGTDLFDDMCEYMRRGVVQATICQNQQDVGAEAVSYAFEYFCKKNSYGAINFSPKQQILITPTVILRAHIE